VVNPPALPALNYRFTERLQWAVDAGGLYWDSEHQRYTRSLTCNLEEFIKRPHLVGLTRELELARPGSWVGSLFDYYPPSLGFSPSEQCLLLSALDGDKTDSELAEVLRVSLPTIKKTWLSIYRRVADRQSEILPAISPLALAFVAKRHVDLQKSKRSRTESNFSSC
jgi:DNA-binding CsgD family transcriptional regulator